MGIFLRAFLTVLGLGSLYAAILDWIERRNPKHRDDFLWMEVVGGVLLTFVPASVARRRYRLHATAFERLIVLCFVGSGFPIILWQIARSIYRMRKRTRPSPAMVVMIKVGARPKNTPAPLQPRSTNIRKTA